MQFRKFKRVLAVIMAVAVTLGTGSVPAYALNSQENAYTWKTATTSAVEHKTELTGSISFSDVQYGSAYVATKVTDNRTSVTDDWKNLPSASSNIKQVTLSNGTSTETIKAENGGVLSLVVTKDDGSVEYQDILDLVENKTTLDASKFVIVESAEIENYTEFAKFGNMAGQDGQYTMRAALYVVDGAVSAIHSVKKLLDGATVNTSGNTTTISDGKLTLNGPFFNGIVANDTDSTSTDTVVNVSKIKFEADGDGADDFKGHGAVLFADGDSTMNVTDTYIHTEGVIRTATAVSGTAKMNITDSVIYTEETNDSATEYNSLVVPMMKRTPFALGLEGVVRATNVLGAGQGIYKNSLIVSSGWGVLSTDSGVAYSTAGTYALNVSNVVAGIGSVEVVQSGKTYTSTKTVNGVEYGYTKGGSGYVAYADTGVYDKFENVTFYGADYVQIMAANDSSAFYTNSTLNSDRIAVMTQQNKGGTISIKNSTVNTGDTGAQIKSGAANDGYTNVVFDNATINFTKSNKWGGTLVELVESDDAGNPGVTEYAVNDSGDTATTATETVADSNATLKNGTYTGNIWNNIYNKAEALNVTIDAATVNGTISSSYGYHVNDNGTRMANGTILTCCTTGDYRVSGASSGDYAKIGSQYNVANKQINNPVNVTLTNNSTWNVVLADGTNGEAAACYINNLTVEAGSKITADTTKYTAANPLTIYVYGTQNISGTVSDNIKLEAAEVEKTTTDTSVTVSKVKTVKVAALKKLKAKIKWSKVSNATKYQVQYSTSKKFTKKTTTTVTVKNARQTTVKGLKNGKKYYVRVRAVNVTDGVKTVGSWSTVKTITAKK